MSPVNKPQAVFMEKSEPTSNQKVGQDDLTEFAS